MNNVAKEASSSRIDLPDDELAAVQRLLAFLYLQDYDDKEDPSFQEAKVISSDGDEPDLAAENNLEVFMAADKFEIPPLKSLARSRLINWINQNAARSPSVAQYIWCTIPPHETELGDAIVEGILCQSREFLSNDEGVMVLKDTPELSVKTLKRIADENARLKSQLGDLRLLKIRK